MNSLYAYFVIVCQLDVEVGQYKLGGKGLLVSIEIFIHIQTIISIKQSQMSSLRLLEISI